MKNGQKGKSSIILRIMIFAVSIYMIVSLCGLWHELAVERSELVRLQKLRDEKNSEIVRLTELLESGNESKIIEKAARERLGYVYADEQVYVDISGN